MIYALFYVDDYEVFETLLGVYTDKDKVTSDMLPAREKLEKAGLGGYLCIEEREENVLSAERVPRTQVLVV